MATAKKTNTESTKAVTADTAQTPVETAPASVPVVDPANAQSVFDLLLARVKN